MARMIPSTPEDFHGSDGERRVFRALRSLPDNLIVIHSLRWVHSGIVTSFSRALKAQGEGDFVLIDPGRGVLVIEVKGGDIRCEQGEWYQRNRGTGEEYRINPEAQANSTVHRIREEVLGRIRGAKDVLFCHAVWFPDAPVDRARLPMNYHPQMVMDADDVRQPEAALKRAFDFWHGQFSTRSGTGDLTESIFTVLAPTLSIVRSVRQTLQEREEKLVQLTREQARVLDFLDEQYHAAIRGAAGTGKTLLAVEKARRIASPTEPVLFLCYNSALRDHLRTHHSQANVTYHTFHGFARDIVGPQGTLEDAVSALLEHLTEDGPLPCEHLIVDEGQDFERDWLEFLRYRFRDRAFYVFYDRYQAIQGEKDASWIDEIPCRLVLSKNCRNTDPIAKSAYRAADLKIAPTLGLDGPRPTLHSAANDVEAVERVGAMIHTACTQHKVPAGEIAVLSLGTVNEGSPWSVEKLGGQPTSENPTHNGITVTTVRRFKGLEASLIFIVDVDFTRAQDAVWRLLLYVACSRARQVIHVFTTTPETALGDAVLAFSGSDRARSSWRTLCRHLGAQPGGTSNDPFHEHGTG